MAQSNELGTILGLGIVGVGIWFLGDMFGWWGGTATAATTTTTAGTTTTTSTATAATPATVTMSGSVTPTINNALQAFFTINGSGPQLISVIPNGDAYNTAGQDITATLAAEGVTPAQLYAMMAAAYTPPASSSSTSSSSSSSSSSNAPTGRGVARNNLIMRRVPINTSSTGTAGSAGSAGGVSGLGQYRPRSAVNYVRRGAAYR
jgi:hypothetical protein